MADSFMSDFKRFFGRGLGILLPTILTLWILWQAFVFVYKNVAEPINRATRAAVVWVVPQVYSQEKAPDWYRVTEEELMQARISGPYRSTTPDAAIRREMRRDFLNRYWSEHWYLNLTGFFIAILLIYMAGVLLGNFFGRKIYHRMEALIARVPGFKQVYPHVKQVVELVLGEKKMAFSKVVLVEYPTKGIWTLGFLTGASLRAIDGPAGGRVVSVFVPTSPTPFTGFTVSVLEKDALAVDVSIEEALRFVITAGVLTPESSGVAASGAGPKVVVASNAVEAVQRAQVGIAGGRPGGEALPAPDPGPERA